MRRLLLVPFVVLALLAAGCGGGGGSGGSSGGSVPAGASIAPSSTAVFASVNTDFESEQWQQTVALFDKFPGGKQLLAQAEKQFKGLSLADVGQALGPETDVLFLDLRSKDVVVITQPKDEAKLQALLAQGDQKPATTTVEGWTVIAQSSKELAAFGLARKDGVLADSDAFKQAMDGLPDEAAAKLYVAGGAVQTKLDRALNTSGAPSGITADFGTLDSIAAAVIAEQNGISLTGDVAASVKDTPETYKPELPSKLPSGALLYVSFAHLDQPLGRIYKALESSQPNLAKQLKLLEGISGLSLEGDVLPILAGEGALAVYPAESGQTLPGIALVLALEDTGKASSLLDRLSTIAGLSGSVHITSTTVGGTPMKKIDVRGVSVLAGVVDGTLVVTNSESFVQGLQSSGDKLADDPRYQQAAKEAALPDAVLGLVYANLKDGLPGVLSFAEKHGATVPPQVRSNTEPLQSALVWVSGDSGNFPFGGFLGIQ